MLDKKIVKKNIESAYEASIINFFDVLIKNNSGCEESIEILIKRCANGIKTSSDIKDKLLKELNIDQLNIEKGSRYVVL